MARMAFPPNRLHFHLPLMPPSRTFAGSGVVRIDIVPSVRHAVVSSVFFDQHLSGLADRSRVERRRRGRETADASLKNVVGLPALERLVERRRRARPDDTICDEPPPRWNAETASLLLRPTFPHVERLIALSLRCLQRPLQLPDRWVIVSE